MSVREASGNSNAAQGLLDKTPLFGGHDDVDDLTLDEMRLKILEKEEMYFSLRLLLKISKETMCERNEVTEKCPFDFCGKSNRHFVQCASLTARHICILLMQIAVERGIYIIRMNLRAPWSIR